MEIKYCSKCHSRVSSVDIEKGAGLVHEGKLYCETCTAELGLTPQAPPKPQTQVRPRPRPQAKTGSGSNAASRPSRRGAASKKAQPSSGAKKKSIMANPMILVGLVVIIALLAVVIVLVKKRMGAQKAAQQAPSEPRIEEPAPVPPEPVEPSEPPEPIVRQPEPEPQPKPQPRPQPKPQPRPQPRPKPKPVVKQPEPAPRPAGPTPAGWQDPIALDPIGDAGKWSAAGGNAVRAGNGFEMSGGGTDIMYKCQTDRFIIEAEALIDPIAKSHRDRFTVFFPRKNATRGNAVHYVTFESDGTVHFHVNEKDMGKKTGAFKKGISFHFKITVDAGKGIVEIDGKKALSIDVPPFPYKGGVQISSNKVTQGFKITFNNARLYLPK